MRKCAAAHVDSFDFQDRRGGLGRVSVLFEVKPSKTASGPGTGRESRSVPKW